MAQFFINRPIFAWVIAIVIMLGGALSIFTLPLEQYPDIAPPRVTIGAQYTGASAETVENSVTQIIEQQLKGIDNMLYMSSTSDASGRARTTLTFAPGTNIDVAQVQVQNKLQSAVNRLPDAVKSRGVFVNKGGQDFLVTYSFFSKDPAMTAVDIGDYLTSNLVDVIGRLDGVGDVNVFGTNYAMRIWMDPAKMEKYALMPSDLVNALNSQNAQVSAGQLGALPAVADQQLNATITARTKLKTVEQFEDIVLKSSVDGSVVLMKDVARVELGADNLTIKAKLNGLPGAGMGIVLADGANAMNVADTIAAKLAELKPFFPNEIDYFVSSDSTPFVRASIKEVVSALGEAMILVVIVMFIFLQNFRATMIPAIAVPVVLLGTFGVLSLAGYSINTLTMFAMVLAIGLLVDDAIVVVENVERVMHETGMSPKQATRQSMREITPALVGIGVTLSAVFVPMAFFGGSTGVIYRQFSITIVAAMALSVFVALTLTPALCATLLKPPAAGGAGHDRPIRSGILGVNDRFFRWFNHHFDATAARYQGTVAYSLRRAKRMMLIFLAVCGVVWLLMARLPTSFLPDEDQGFVFVNINLPSGAADTRLQGVLDEVRDYFAKQPDVLSFYQVSGLNGDQASARAFVRLKTWEERPLPGQSASEIAHRATRELASIRDARVLVMLPPAVRGLGSSSGFNFMIKDMNGLGHQALLQAKEKFLTEARKRPELTNLRMTNLEDASELRLDIDDRKAAALGLSYTDINSVLSSAMGGTYVNDFLNNERVKRVYIQGDAPHRMLPQDIAKWTVRNGKGEMVPFSAFSSSYWAYGSPQLMRYNGNPAYEMEGRAAPGVSSGTAMQIVEDILRTLPAGIGYEWTGASLQERQSGAQAPLLYAISILFVFLCLAALYESWTVPLSVMLAVPLGVVGALAATYTRGLTNDVYFQVGLLTTVGLASKNAILIVEFAVQLQEQGKSIFDAVVSAVRLRLRPILMTSLAFGFGVIPLAIGTGAGAGGRNAIGTAVLGGMLASTVLGIFLVPVFFLLIRSWFKSHSRTDEESPQQATDSPHTTKESAA
ncbi:MULTISPECIES: efflux RND transporter permease subunit [Delftia]|uniref:efflux RND transporter permease subunit n=1 Tax=Delftia TaxID=80865 RepID=UPI000354863E|nr:MULTISPECIES: efflux RND transporter permease subunit [Delftia]EPD41421.1 HAE1 family hydrophobic/amphiphilic exporter-1 (mainly G- bacteria) [Delftia acidovorans CCUG 274B]MCX7505956.1 efflux RND transporter permease subunit [Delftia tsuruhatensis]MDH0849460.1 efflux RND transporter permease subunit [Delftia tsuruhatensis]MXN29950.1 multidrug efflux RND transporter permease subunit [Delftia sp. CH05]WEL96490.1 efflux RND transporter permease subunit [Delftia tsuruhatensis]